MSGTSLEPSKSIGAFPDVPDLPTSGEEAYVYFHIDPTHTNFINRIIEGYEYLGVMTSIDVNDVVCQGVHLQHGPWLLNY